MSTSGNKDFRRLRGILKRLGQRPFSVEEMDEAIMQFVAEDMRRINERTDSDADEVETESESD